ncbi:LytTR family DNA-binding domain-containing protein [Aliiglaciecola sp. CAU 1673]|uniref:LytR/AlgR family response regulator transcription factor n=1 Tax=Aliiglaciecola sp. CAU 1673 TaxID=3032595 RepID=UPI0023DBE1BE|nr:LytTR family DNA-binding domain-containing protein [Aliiglaciecola sp. CAU 1673]MDF2176693.1 LytTR family DNA-binding domain-containing protein [Aliiglaciecola sp. CAU 1673]
MDKVRVLIVDDEELAREGLQLHLQDIEGVEVLACCANGREALEAVERLMPELLLVDIEMPLMNGIELVAEINRRGWQLEAIYVTAFDKFAATAYGQGVKDYLLKPIDAESVKQSVDGFRRRRREREAEMQLQKLEGLIRQRTGKTLGAVQSQLENAPLRDLPTLNPYLSLKNGTQWFRIKIADICWVEAAGDFVCVHSDKDSQIARQTLTNIASFLDPDCFCRVSRSAIINLNKLEQLTPNANGEYHAQLTSGALVKVSRIYKSNLPELRRH